jgi:hypothetical protein
MRKTSGPKEDAGTEEGTSGDYNGENVLGYGKQLFNDDLFL